MFPRAFVSLQPSPWQPHQPEPGTAITFAPDHREFIAMLYAPYVGDGSGAAGQVEARTFLLNFSYRYARRQRDVLWLLEIVAPDGTIICVWHGVERLRKDVSEVSVHWNGLGSSGALSAAIYRARMLALSRRARARKVPRLSLRAIRRALERDDSRIEQSWDLKVGAQVSSQ